MNADGEIVGPRAPGSVEVAGVGRSFGPRQVLRDVDLTVASGTASAVIGANGSGKTTLLRIVAGVLDADEGRVTVAGRPAGGGSSAFVPAGDRMLHWRLTAGANLDFYAALSGAREERSALVAAAAAMMGAQDLLALRVGECSTGQRRRLMIAAALVTCAPVLLLDEPYADLDDIGKEHVARVSGGWTERGGCVVFATTGVDECPPAVRSLFLPNGRREEAG
jgi:iron(III) transport system ATP-binding protein